MYSGNGGVTRRELQLGSINWRMHVTGRTRLYKNFVLQQEMKASATAIPTFAYASAATSRANPRSFTTWVRIEME